jgi:hypothetical protein
MRPARPVLLIAALYVLHQDIWFWREARPLVFGFLPIGLFYHAAFTVGCALVLWLLVSVAWPEHLEAMTPDLKRGMPPGLKVGITPDLKVGPTPDSIVGPTPRG